jgi:hypothetical protein
VAWNICKQAPRSPACVSKEKESLSFVEKKSDSSKTIKA